MKMEEIRDTRTVYGETLINLAKNNPRIVAVETDLMKAAGSFPFKEAFPERSINVGIAEQNAMSVAAGMAMKGMIPFVSSFACFAAQRACDQALNSVAYNGFNVKVVGTYAGLTSEKNGGTHISICDLAIFRSMPGFVVIDPGDPDEFESVLCFAADYTGPVYIRSNKGKFASFCEKGKAFQPGKAKILQEGEDAGLITTGITTIEGIKACEALKEKGIHVCHLHMPTVKPIDREAVVELANSVPVIVTAENHSVIGGLGSATAEVLCEAQPARLIRLGLQDHFGETATLAYMMHKYGIDAESIVNEISRFCGNILTKRVRK